MLMTKCGKFTASSRNLAQMNLARCCSLFTLDIRCIGLLEKSSTDDMEKCLIIKRPKKRYLLDWG
jgi:hypothetical protein